MNPQYKQTIILNRCVLIDATVFFLFIFKNFKNMKTIRKKLMQIENRVFSNWEKTYSDYSEYTLICISEYGKLSYDNNIPFSTCLARARMIKEKSKTITFIVFTKDWEKLENTIHF